ncbi:MAG: response regulator transcription factor [Phycisphaeraceae bacterium]|nr:response regulator transcription factor [Phycisphaeraceae bacterium]
MRLLSPEKLLNPDPTRVFVIDTHPSVRHGLGRLLDGEPDIVLTGEAEDIPEAITRIHETEPDLVLVDLDLGEASGLDLLRHLHRQWVGLRSIVVSQYPPELYADAAADAGARGYVVKQNLESQIVDAIRVVRSDGLFFKPL